MVSSITGLPAIVIDNLKGLDINLDSDNEGTKQPLLQNGDESLALKQFQDEQLPKGGFEELNTRINTMLDNESLAMEFTKDEITDKMIIKIIDSKTNEVVQQLPPEVTLKVARIVANTLGNGQITNAKV